MTMHDDRGAADDPAAGERETPATERADAASIEEPLLRRGTPVFGRDDSRLGELARDGDEGGALMMRRALGGPEFALPDGVVSSIEPNGVYTNLSWDDLSALSPPPPPDAETGMLEAFETGAESAHANRFEDDEPE